MKNIPGIHKSKQILFCRCNGERIDSGMLSEIENFIHDLPVNITLIDDMCYVAARSKKSLENIFEADSDYIVIGCYPRTMSLLLEQSTGKKIPCEITWLNMFELSSSENVVGMIKDFLGDFSASSSKNLVKGGTDWIAWYPVLDYSRCTNCGQCSEFCLFGVYERTDEKVAVIKPDACKNNCPACARICPSTAIIIPKYKNGGAIGGSAQIDEAAEQQRQAQDIEILLNGNLYDALEKRKARRQSIIRAEALKKAYEERDRAKSEKK